MADFAKKLTVSFGAFSCTLSGFDDPFPVMSQVVDYFQKLSKTDPSFGAHPERPDTEALRVLAEQTSGLSVGAEMKGDEVVLSSVAEDIPDAFDTMPAPSTQMETVVPQAAIEATDLSIDSPQKEIRSEVANEKSIGIGAETANTILADQPEAPPEPVAEANIEDIEAVVSKAFLNDDLVSIDETIESAEAQPETAQHVDMFEQLQVEDLDDELFENIDAEEFYEELQPEVETVAIAPVQEDVSAYVNEGIAFIDVENPDENELRMEIPEDNAPKAEADPIPVWAAELVSDEPIEEIEVTQHSTVNNQARAFDSELSDTEVLTYDDHVEAEQTALSRILAATHEVEGRSDAIPSDDKPDLSEHHQVSNEDELTIDEDAANTVKSLVLGFGDAASFDATREITTSTIDNRTKANNNDALAALGMFEEDEEDFGWSLEESAPTEAPVTSEALSTNVEPLLLTPMQRITPTPPEQGSSSHSAPSSTINMDQDDPRADLRRFADAAGAVSMTDLLEASAAYRTLVNGRPSFSRGEVLELLDEFSDDGFSQETRIKTFGSLLRGGRIQRVDNGEYEMSLDALSEYEDVRQVG